MLFRFRSMKYSSIICNFDSTVIFAVRSHFPKRFVPSCDLVMQCVSVAGSLFCHYPRTGVSTSRRKWALACCTSSSSSTSSSTSGKWGLACCCSLNYAVITSSTPLSLHATNATLLFVQCQLAHTHKGSSFAENWNNFLPNNIWLTCNAGVVLVLILS